MGLSWNPRHGVWYYQLTVPGGGKVRRGGFTSETETSNELDKARDQAGKGVDITRRITVGQYLDEWLNGKKDISRNTRRSYAQHIRDYFKPHLADIELGQLRKAHVDGVFAAIDERTISSPRHAPGRSRDPRLGQGPAHCWTCQQAAHPRHPSGRPSTMPCPKGSSPSTSPLWSSWSQAVTQTADLDRRPCRRLA